MSSGNLLDCRKGLVFGIGLTGLEAVVEAPQEAVEQVALRGSVPIAGHAPSVVVSSGTGGEAQSGEGPEVADGGEALVLDFAVEHDELLAASPGDRGGASVRLETAGVGEASGASSPISASSRAAGSSPSPGKLVKMAICGCC